MKKITNVDKVDLVQKPQINIENKVVANDLNDIKEVVNDNADEAGNSADLSTTDKTNIVAGVNEVKTQANNLESNKANDADVVHKTGDVVEDVTGRKTFKSEVKVDYDGSNSTTIKDNQIYIFDSTGIETYLEKGGVNVDTEGGSYRNSVNFPKSNSENITVDFKDESGTVALVSDVEQKANLLIKGSDAYAHAERGVVDGFEVNRLVQLDQHIDENLRDSFNFKAGFGQGIGKIPVAIPDISAADFSLTRNSTATFVNKRGIIEEAPANVPRFDWTSGEPRLLLEDSATNTIANSKPNSTDVADLNVNYEQKNIYFFGGDTNVFTFSENTFGYRYSGTPFINQDNAYSFYVIMNDGSEPIVADNSAEGDFSIRYAYTGAETIPLANIEKEHLGNGLWRIKSVYNIPSGAAALSVVSSSTNRGFSCTQIDLVQSNKVTSPIPTNGSSETRAADTNVKTGDISAQIDSTSFVFEVSLSFDDDIKQRYCVSDGSSFNRVRTTLEIGGSMNSYLDIGGISSQALIQYKNINSSILKKFQYYVKGVVFKLKVDGVIQDSNTSNDMFLQNSLSRIDMSEVNDTLNVVGTSKGIAVKSAETFDSTATTVEELKASITNYIYR